MTWFRRRPTPVEPRDDDDAREALSKSVDELLGAVRLHGRVDAIDRRTERVLRVNHLEHAVAEIFREHR